MKPTIECFRPLNSSHIEYKLVIPDQWLMETRWIKFSLSLWLLRLVWINNGL